MDGYDAFLTAKTMLHGRHGVDVKPSDIHPKLFPFQNAITRWRYGLPADYWDRYPERIMAITEADAQAMAKKYLDPSRLQIVAVGNEEAVARTLRKLGAVDVYDADGKKVRVY